LLGRIVSNYMVCILSHVLITGDTLFSSRCDVTPVNQPAYCHRCHLIKPTQFRCHLARFTFAYSMNMFITATDLGGRIRGSTSYMMETSRTWRRNYYYLTAGCSSGLRSRLQNQRPRIQIPIVSRGFCDEQLHLLTSHGCLYILLSI
jgi:hypothetical protein